MIIGNRTFTEGTHVMGILNVTPDSFFAGSRVTEDDVLFRAERMVKEGVAVFDVGAQSTRPGHIPVSPEEEMRRLEKIVPLLKKEFDVPLSVDTYFPSVADFVLERGADLINDVWGLRYGEGMAEVVAAHRASVCIMHNQNGTQYTDLFGDIETFLKESLSLAEKAGVERDKICLDGGIGFGKTKEQNFLLLEGYDKLSSLGYPLLLGVSRKSMFGGLPEERLAPTLEATKLAVKKQILFVRVHDVAENVRAIREAQCR